MSRAIIQQYKIHAKKSLGQNFLVDEQKLNAIGECIDIVGKNIVEVGPGYGALTEIILKKNPQALHLVELDRDMVNILQERYTETGLLGDRSLLKIFQQDVLQFTPEFKDYSIIANIPYYITSPILHHFLYELEHAPKKMLILMQKDVGDKILAGIHGTGTEKVPVPKRKSSVLSLMIAKKCFVREKLFVPKECFIPAPKVESSVLLFETHEKYSEIDDANFLEFIKKGFLAPRKKLTKNLTGAGYPLSTIEEFICLQGRDINMRGEDGDIDFWIDFYKFLK